jgi:hypothetical protein
MSTNIDYDSGSGNNVLDTTNIPYYLLEEVEQPNPMLRKLAGKKRLEQINNNEENGEILEIKK